MAVFNLGSINLDNVYSVPHLPQPGETLPAMGFAQGLGGKGANMSVAIARAAARAIHIGSVGPDGRWAVERLMEYGVDTRHISTASAPTGHANICVDQDGENSIVLFSGANQTIESGAIRNALSEAGPSDSLLMQNETNGQREATQVASDGGLRIVYAAAPYETSAVQSVLGHLDLLILNAVEAEQLSSETGSKLEDLPVADIIVTKGSEGCLWISDLHRSGKAFDAIASDVVDTTGAGDTFTGFLVAGLDRGLAMEQAIVLATRAASIMVSRHGTADVIPDLRDIEERFLT